MKKDDEFGIEKYGKERWESIVDNFNYDEGQKALFFMNLINDKSMKRIIKVIKEALNMEDTNFTWELKKHSVGSPRIIIKSENLIKYNPILKYSCKEFNVVSENGNVCGNNINEYGSEDYYKEKSSEFYYCFDLSFDYTHTTGGRNGVTIGRFSVYTDKIVYYLYKDFYKETEDGYLSHDKNAIKTVSINL